MFLIELELAKRRQAEYHAQAHRYQRTKLWARIRQQERQAQRLAGRAQRLTQRAGDLQTRARTLRETASVEGPLAEW